MGAEERGLKAKPTPKKQLVIQQFLLSDSITFSLSFLPL